MIRLRLGAAAAATGAAAAAGEQIRFDWLRGRKASELTMPGSSGGCYTGPAAFTVASEVPRAAWSEPTSWDAP